jgi:hypothetical protein
MLPILEISNSDKDNAVKLTILMCLVLLTACNSQPTSDLPPSANKTRDDILARVAQDFPEDQTAVLAMLDEYQGDTEAGRNRVQWVILEYSSGEITRVRELVDLAQIDYRDVLMLEYSE